MIALVCFQLIFIAEMLELSGKGAMRNKENKKKWCEFPVNTSRCL